MLNYRLVKKEDDVLRDDIISDLDKIGTTGPTNYTKLQPIQNSSKKGLSGRGVSISPTYVGHVGLCSEMDCLVYQSQRERPQLLDSVDGKGVAVSKKIINSLENVYEAEYVFVGLRETGDIFVIPVESFNNHWHTKNYDEQYYARLDKDVVEHIPGRMDTVFCRHPSESNRSISMNEAHEILESNRDSD